MRNVIIADKTLSMLWNGDIKPKGMIAYFPFDSGYVSVPGEVKISLNFMKFSAYFVYYTDFRAHGRGQDEEEMGCVTVTAQILLHPRAKQYLYKG